MPRYELVEGTSSKFWEIALEGASFTTRYGRIGTAGQSTTKSFASPADATREHDKIVAEKMKKGYKLVGGESPAAAAPPPKAPAKAAAATAKPGGRWDLALYNEATGFVVTSAKKAGSGLDPSVAAGEKATRAGDLLPFELYQDDSFNLRVVLDGDLDEKEAEEWVGRLEWKLRVTDGNLVVAAGIEFLLEEEDDGWADSEFVHVVEIPPGEYRAEMYAYLPGVNGWPFWEAVAAGEHLPLYFKRTRGKKAKPPAWIEDEARGEGIEYVDFVLRLTPLGDAKGKPAMPALDGGWFYKAFERRKPERCPLGIEARDLRRKQNKAMAAAAAAGPRVARPADVFPRVEGLALAPVRGGPVELPAHKLYQAFAFAWYASDSADPEVRVEFPPGEEGIPADVIPAHDLVAARREGATLRIGFEPTGAKWSPLQAVRAAAPGLAEVPDGSVVELACAQEPDTPGRRPDAEGLIRLRGRVEGGRWKIAESYPALDAATLADALALGAACDGGGKFALRDEDEAEAVMKKVKKDEGIFGKNMPVRRGLVVELPRPDDTSSSAWIAMLIFRVRHAEALPSSGVDDAMDDLFGKIAAQFAAAAEAPGKGELLLAGKAGTFHRNTSLDASPGSEIEAADRALAALGFGHLGDMTFSMAGDIVIRGYARDGGPSWVVLMRGKFGQKGADFVTRFADGWTLTTTTTSGQVNDPDKKCYKASVPADTPIAKLSATHDTRLRNLTKKHGAPVPAKADLRALAEEMDRFFSKK